MLLFPQTRFLLLLPKLHLPSLSPPSHLQQSSSHSSKCSLSLKSISPMFRRARGEIFFFSFHRRLSNKSHGAVKFEHYVPPLTEWCDYFGIEYKMVFQADRKGGHLFFNHPPSPRENPIHKVTV
ncbi:hypothetical protein CEXT_586531 [Caerostris extrusa]|uniref:Uncharacterized protein n=1 Tax=Caerostris extrusa TaxID=172846 RepID=A0AAV4RE06_CAEEX|nr:hypothetical protein CEXT_586531 [Caerostris extrusa]